MYISLSLSLYIYIYLCMRSRDQGQQGAPRCPNYRPPLRRSAGFRGLDPDRLLFLRYCRHRFVCVVVAAAIHSYDYQEPLITEE